MSEGGPANGEYGFRRPIRCGPKEIAALIERCDDLMSKLLKENRAKLQESLLEAARLGLDDYVEVLLNKGANIHDKDNAGNSARILAAGS